MPLVYSSKKGKVGKNTKVTVTEVVGNWCFVETDDQEGWIMTSKLEANQNSTEESKNEEDKKDENKTEEKEETTVNAKGTRLYVSTSTLNLREKADTSSRILEQLEQNDEVAVVDTVDSTWTKVTARGVTGYVATKYLSKEKSKEVSSRSSEDRKEKSNNDTNTTTQNTTKNSSTTSKDTANTNSNSNQTAKTTTKTEEKNSSKKEEKKTESNDDAKSSSKVTGANTFDCSGFTSYVYKHFGYTLNRTSTDQRSNGTAVKKANLQAGDIVCFSGHVGIYVGDGKFIHAANSKKGVIISSLSESYYSKNYITARRILN